MSEEGEGVMSPDDFRKKADEMGDIANSADAEALPTGDPDVPPPSLDMAA